MAEQAPARGWRADDAAARALAAAFAPFDARLGHDDELTLDEFTFELGELEALERAVWAVCGAELDLDEIHTFADHAHTQGPITAADFIVVAQVYAYLWFELLAFPSDDVVLERRQLCGVACGLVNCFEQGGRLDLAMGFAESLRLSLPVAEPGLAGLLATLGFAALAPQQLHLDAPDDIEHGLILHAATMMSGARAALVLGCIDEAEALLAARGWTNELSGEQQRALERFDQLWIASRVSLARGDGLTAKLLADQAVDEAEGLGNYERLACGRRSQLYVELGLGELPIPELPLAGQAELMTRRIADYDARDRGLALGESRLREPDALAQVPEFAHIELPARLHLNRIISRLVDGEADVLERERAQLLSIAQTQGETAIRASILLMLSAPTSSPDFGALFERARAEIDTLDDLLELDAWIGLLVVHTHATLAHARSWSNYADWVEHVNDAVERWPELRTPELAQRHWRMDMVTLERGLDRLEQVGELGPGWLHERCIAAAMRRLRAGLGRGLRHELAWKRATRERPPWLAHELDAIASARSREDWPSFAARREQMLLRTIGLRKAAPTPDPAPTEGALPELILRLADGGRMLAYDNFEGRLRRREWCIDARLFTVLDDVLDRMPIPGLARELAPVAEEHDERSWIDEGLRELADRLPVFRATPSRYVLRCAGALQRIPIAALPGADGSALGLQHVAIIAASARTPDASSLFVAHPMSALVIADPQYGPAIPPLPGTRREAECIVDVLGLREDQQLLGAHATRDNVLARLRTAAPALVHVGAHGVGDALDAPRSCIMLGRHRTQVFSPLTFDDICALDLRTTQLVVLSACSTMRGRARHAEGLLALSWAFKAAGARMVLAARWPVIDQAAPEFWRSFYALLREHGDVCEALLGARHDNAQRGHGPESWAVYQLTC